MRQRVFIASSSRHQHVLTTIADRLRPDVDPVEWTDGRQELGRTILDWAVSMTGECEFGVFVLAPDERWAGRSNGNVLFELGLFMGCRGADRCFIVKPMDFDLPADLRSIIHVDYDPQRTDDPTHFDQAAALIRAAMNRRTTFADEITGLWMQRKTTDPEFDESRYALVEFVIQGGDLQAYGRSYYADGSLHADWPLILNQCWNPPDSEAVYHTWDARYGRGDCFSAFGVTFYSFDADYAGGHGYFLVHGAGTIQQGLVEFSLTRVTSEFLATFGLEVHPFGLDDRRRCAALVRAVSLADGADEVIP